MATTRRDVELRINANDLSGKSLAELLDTFEKLKKAQDEMNKAAGDGTRHIRELTGDVKDLQAVALEAKSRGALVDQFVALESAATKASARLEATKQKLADFNAKQKEGATLVGKQAATFDTLTTQVANAEKAFEKAKGKVKEFEQQLGQLGAGGAEKTRTELLKFGDSIGEALSKAEQAVRRYDEVLRESALKEEAATKAKREAAIAAADLKKAQDALTSSVAFNQQGRDALKAASNVEVLSRDYDKLAVSSRKAGEGIREILDPSRQVLGSLDALEAEVKRLNSQLDAVKVGPGLGEELKRIRDQYNALTADAGKAAASLVDDIGVYRKVEQSVAELRTRLEGARQSVAEFASNMALATVPSEKLSSDLSTAQTKLRGLVGAFDSQSQTLAGLRLRLQEAGVDVNKLADAEGRLIAVATGVVDSQRKIEAVAARVTKLAQATQKLKEAQDDLAGGVAFNQLGKDALKAAGGVEALSRDYDALAATSRKAGDGIRGIIDPSRQALTTLDGLETQTRSLNEQLQKAASSAKLREEVRKLRSEYGALATDAGKAASALVDDIGSYRQAEQALGTLRARVEAAQQSVRKFAGQMAVATTPSKALADSLAQAKAQLNTLVADFARQSTALAKLRSDLRDAGVATDKLTEAEKRLQNIGRGVVVAQEALGVAAVKVGVGATKAANGLNLFDDRGRKALSTAQRLRGQMLSLASSYLGLFAAVNLAKGTIETAVSREGILRRLELVEGSAEKARIKFDELGEASDRLGVNFLRSAKGFSDIAIGAKEAGLSTEQVDRFFENLTTTTRGLALSGEKTERVFTAVSQVFGKNRLQSEELRQQLGEHLPAVLTKAAAALNLTAEELDKSLEAGNLSVHSLVVIIDEYAKLIRGLSKQNQSAVSSLAKFGNAMDRLKLAIGDSGFLKEFTELLEDAVVRFNAGEFDDAIRGLGNLFKLAAQTAKFLLENIKLVEVAFVSLIALNVGKLLFGLIGSMRSFATSTGLVAGAVRVLGVAFAFLAAHPIVAVILGLAALVVGTEKGRGALRALWQVIVEIDRELTTLLSGNFSGFASRVESSMKRVGDAFRGAKEDAEALNRAARGGSGKVGFTGSTSGSFKDSGSVTGTWADDAAEMEARRRAEAELTNRTVADIERSMADLRKAAAKGTAKTIHDIEGEVRAEYQDTQDRIDELTKRAAKTNDAATAAAVKTLQGRFDKEIAIIVAAKKKQAAASLTKGERGGIADELEQAKQRAEAIKDGLRLEQVELEQSYKEGIVSLRAYYAQRLEQTQRGLDAEIAAAREQIVILEREQARDPSAAKKITKLQGEITGKIKEKVIAERQFAFEAKQAEKALRRQVDAVQQELDLLTGDALKAGMRAIEQSYTDQLALAEGLEGAEKERALAVLKTLNALHKQLLAVDVMSKAVDELNSMRQEAIDDTVAGGGVSRVQESIDRSTANKLYLADLQRLAETFTTVEERGTEAYAAILAKIKAVRGETDLLAKDVAVHAKDAATAFVTTLVESKSPAKAFRAFGKSLGQALSETFIDAAATAIVNWLKGSGGLDTLKGIFSFVGGMFGGTTTAPSGHAGAVIGYGGAVPKRVSPFAFIGAPRYHAGGLPGLRRDEVAFIGKKGEEVLSRNDPRNVLNGGKTQGTASNAGPGGFRLEVHPDALHMTLRDWFEREIARAAASS